MGIVNTSTTTVQTTRPTEFRPRINRKILPRRDAIISRNLVGHATSVNFQETKAIFPVQNKMAICHTQNSVRSSKDRKFFNPKNRRLQPHISMSFQPILKKKILNFQASETSFFDQMIINVKPYQPTPINLQPKTVDFSGSTLHAIDQSILLPNH